MRRLEFFLLLVVTLEYVQVMACVWTVIRCMIGFPSLSFEKTCVIL